jgi:hypothetical protein
VSASAAFFVFLEIQGIIIIEAPLHFQYFSIFIGLIFNAIIIVVKLVANKFNMPVWGSFLSLVAWLEKNRYITYD